MKLSELLSKYGDVEVTEEQEQEIKDKLVIKGNKAWKPKEGEAYYFIIYWGNIGCDICDGSESFENLYALDNCFKTEEEAKFKCEKDRVIKELKDYATEHNEWELDWEDCDQRKWDISYDFDECEIRCDFNLVLKRNDIYFTSKEIAEEAVKAVGEVRVKKYYLEVNDNE